MIAGKYSWDTIVLGYSLEAAIAVALLAKRGWTAAWVGGAPPATVQVGGHAIIGAPSLAPSRHFTPALNRALDHLKLLTHNAPLGPSTTWQLLDEELRASLPADLDRLEAGEEELETLKTAAAGHMRLTISPIQLGFFGERAARRNWRTSPPLAPAGAITQAAEMARQVFGLQSTACAATLLAEPHDLQGGVLKLGAMLQKSCADMSVRIFQGGLQKRLKSFRHDWSEVGCTLASGEDLTARVFLFAVPDTEVDSVLPEGTDTARYQSPDPAPMMRLLVAVRSRGLPAALARFALLRADCPVWIERHPINNEYDGCAFFWASDSRPVEQQRDAVMKAFTALAPFVEPHIAGIDGPTPVPQYGTAREERPWKIARRVLDARGPVLGLRGLEGAALAGAALAQQVMKLSPRKDPLKDEMRDD